MNILEKQATAKAGPAQSGPAQGDDAESNPAYLKAKELMLSKLYEEGVADGLGQAILAAPDPLQGVIDQVMALLDVMEQATQGSVPDELVMPFVVDTISEVVEIAEKVGVQLAEDQIAVVVREVLAQVVETLGGDSTAIREEMASIDPAEVARQAMAQGEG